MLTHLKMYLYLFLLVSVVVLHMKKVQSECFTIYLLYALLNVIENCLFRKIESFLQYGFLPLQIKCFI